MAGGRVAGGDDVQHRHAESGDQPGARGRRRRQLGVVGLSAHRHDDGVLLRPAVAAAGRADRSRVLRDAVLGPRGDPGARLPRGLSGPAVQLCDHGVGQPGGGQDRQRAAWLADVGDPAGVRGPQRRICRHLWAVGRHGHRHDPVRHRDDRLVCRSLLRSAAARGRRPGGPDAADRSADLASVARPVRLGHVPHRPADPDHRAVVVGVVSRRRAGRRQLRRAAHARIQVREGCRLGHAVLQRRALRAAALAVDHRRAGVDPGLSHARGHQPRAAPRGPLAHRPRHGVSRRCCAFCRRA